MAAAVFVLLVGACRGGSTDIRNEASPDERTTPAVAANPAARVASPGAIPEESPRAALEAMLAAEQKGDHATSFALLSPEAREAFTSVGEWARRRAELAPITGYEIDGDRGSDGAGKNGKHGEDGTRVVALVRHEPGLDPFVGLRPARERQTWRAVEVDAGWLLDAEPEVVPLLPAADGAPVAAKAWAEALQACDAPQAASLQAVDPLLGVSDAPAKLCNSTGALSAGAPRTVPGGPASAELVAQYGSEAFSWAKAVAVTGGPRPFHLVLAPIRDDWRVVGVFEQ